MAHSEPKELVATAEAKPIQNCVEPTVVQPTPIPGTVPSSQPSTVNTADNNPPIAVTAEEVKERCPPKAMVKPQVLTHVIEDFVIQESSEPFPITRSSLLGDLKPTQSSNEKDCDEPPRKLTFNDTFLQVDLAPLWIRCVDWIFV